MNECLLTPQHENYIGCWVLDNVIHMKRLNQKEQIPVLNYTAMIEWINEWMN